METVKLETRGERLLRLRKAKGWTQPHLGELVGVTKANVSKWEATASPNIDLDVFFKLAKVFEIDPEELATGVRWAAADISDIPQRRIALIRLYGDLPKELRHDIRQLIHTLSAAHSERYASWSREEGERARVRDTRKKTPAAT